MFTNTAIELENRVFLALAGEDINIQFKVVQPVNQSGTGECFNPTDELIQRFEPSQPTTTVNVKLTNVTSANTGEYRCEYKTAMVYWTLLVRGKGRREAEVEVETGRFDGSEEEATKHYV